MIRGCLKLLPTQIDEVSLATIGKEASAMLMRRDFSGLAERFGYALSFDRSTGMAIEEDYLRAVESPSRARAASVVKVDVKFFAPNDTGLFAVVECLVPTGDGAYINLELIVTGFGAEKFVTLEDINGGELS